MRNRILVMASLAIGAASLVWSGVSLAKDPKGDKAPPAAVLEAVKKAYPQGTVGRSKRENIALTVYEVTVKNGDETVHMVVAKDGTVVELEGRVAESAAPAAVTAAISKVTTGGGKLRELERAERRAKLALVALAEPKVTFEAVCDANGKKVELYFAADGTPLEDDDDDDDGDEDDDDGEDDDDDDDDDDDGKGMKR